MLINAVLQHALGCAPKYINQVAPVISFELGSPHSDLGCRSVEGEDQSAIAEQLLGAFFWCANRFPLSILTMPENDFQQSIIKFVVGRSSHRGEYISASSPKTLRVVLLAADWPLKSHYRLASLIAHESMHNLLFIREAVGSPVRSGSLGYSPWKTTLRQGRLVWHSYWTFVCQFVMLGESILSDSSLLQADPGLTRYLAQIQARIIICSESIKDFKVVNDHELSECDSALAFVDEVSRQLLCFPEFRTALTQAKAEAFKEFATWATALVESK